MTRHDEDNRVEDGLGVEEERNNEEGREKNYCENCEKETRVVFGCIEEEDEGEERDGEKKEPGEKKMTCSTVPEVFCSAKVAYGSF